MGRSQESFNKKKREKERDQKKKKKLEKRLSKKESEVSGKGPEIDWSSAPNNLTLTQEEEAAKNANKANNLNT